jgi:hypothetical protein
MIRKNITKSKAILLGMLTLLVLLTVFIPWKEMALKYSEFQARTNSIANLVWTSRKQVKNTLTWRVNTEYSPKRGVLQLNISHKDNAPFNDLKLVAEFNSYRSAMPGHIAILHNQSEGIYRIDNIWLTKGDWLMSLTGRLRSKFIFRREQLLHVS